MTRAFLPGRVLLLGGTAEAGRLAHALADRGIEAIYSYAGRTDAPAAQPLPLRIGGFGGAEGLARFLRAERIGALIDATHPFAANISRNAAQAAALVEIPLIAMERPAWVRTPQDDWQEVADIAAAVRALPQVPERIFLALGRQALAAFAERPQHHYLLRLVDPPQSPLPLPRAQAVIARGPFALEGDIGLLRDHRIDRIVAKNAGGLGAFAKVLAARALGLPMVMIARPAMPPRRVVEDVQGVMGWLHSARLGA